MAAKKMEQELEQEVTNYDDGLTIQMEEKDTGYKGPMVPVFLPALEDSGSAGLRVDQYEHVTIANEEKETTFYVKRGIRVDVPVPVFVILKERYPNL